MSGEKASRKQSFLQGDLIDEAEQLDNDGRGGQDRHAL